MFLCQQCHKDEEDICGGHIIGSIGECERCGAVGQCYDCRAYKRLSLEELQARAQRRPTHGKGRSGDA